MNGQALFGLLCISSIAISAEPPAKLSPCFHPPVSLANDLGKYQSPLLFDDGKPVRNADDWAKRRTEIRKYWHGMTGEWPRLIEKPKIEYLAKETLDGYTRHHVRIETAPDRITDDAYLLVPEGKGPFPAVLVVFYEAKTAVGLGKALRRDFALQLVKRGFVTLSLGGSPTTYYPTKETCKIQPLSFHAYEAANCANLLANLPSVDASRIGVTGHSYGGKWAMFAACLCDRFACGAWSDPGVAFDESRSNVNYWEPWYLGFEPGKERKPGIPDASNPRTGPYAKMIESGRDLHEFQSLMAPRPMFVSGGAEDQPERWKALNHVVAVNKLLGYENRVGMSNRPLHDPTDESNELLCLFFESVLKSAPTRK